MNKNIFILFFIFYSGANAQSVIPLSGFQNVLPLYNPAAAGLNEGPELALLYKTLWNGISGAPKTYAFTINTPFNYNRFGIGLNVSKESAGIQSVLSASGLFSYKINLANGRLSFGTKLGMVQWSQDFSNLTIKDESESLTGNKKTLLDLGAGLLYKDKKYTLGFSMNYSPGIYLGYKNTNKIYYNVSGETKLKINSAFILYPALLIRYTEKFSPIINISLPLEYNNFLWMGLSYRSSTVLSFMAGINLHKLMQNGYDRITVFYYFDYSAGRTTLKPGNTNEIMLCFNPVKNKSIETIKRKRATMSPLFFD
ncbi:MAG TPA: PorP/SprF family type IX secretion system membrane protein [Cytophagaceae bacterium]|jgi:type IX secretion system PorP/SprF family membrane protein|nr:PorP/SprF family type IX secretion system membrane protein [Cytophagaceae bacterium]